jgi:hypothetical protein
MSLMYAQMGMSIIGAANSFGAAKHESKIARMTQAYNNKMADISLAQTKNNLTRTEINIRDAGVRASEAIQLQALEDSAMASVTAAHAGASGSSVDDTMQSLTRSRLRASGALKYRLKQQGAENLNNRRNAQMQAVYGRDVSPISGPSVSASLLGLGVSMLDIYDRNTPDT